MTPKPQKRSVSPFGSSLVSEDDPLSRLKSAFKEVFPPIAGKIPSELKILDQAAFVPALVEKLWNAPASDAPQLDNLCQYLLRFRDQLEQKGLAGEIEQAMKDLFKQKTELFMIDQQDTGRVVLFAKERDALVGRYFAPVTESAPGKLSEFVTAWMESDNPDRILHFLDFCAGSQNPTFEHYLLFTHPAFHRVVSNRAQMRALFEKAAGPLSKINHPAWTEEARKVLGV